MINIWIKANCFNFSMPKNISASNSLAIQVKVYYNTINTTNHRKRHLGYCKCKSAQIQILQ